MRHPLRGLLRHATDRDLVVEQLQLATSADTEGDPRRVVGYGAFLFHWSQVPGPEVHLDGGNGFTFGLLHRTEAARADRAEQRLPASWTRMTKPKNTRWLGRSATAADPNDQR